MAAIPRSRIAFDARVKQVNITVESILKYTDETEFARIQMELLLPETRTQSLLGGGREEKQRILGRR